MLICREDILKAQKIRSYGDKLEAGFFYRKLNLFFGKFFYQRNLVKILQLKVAVHLHLFYLDLLDEFIESLKNIPHKFDLFITLVDCDQSKIAKIFTIFPNTKVFSIPNIGRDVGGLIEVINNIDLNDYDVLIKLHSKKSLHTGFEQKDWRQRLTGALIGNKFQSALVLSKFCDKKIGMIGSFEDLSFIELENRDNFKNFCKKFEISDEAIFFRGTVFAIRTKILQRFKEKKIILKDFENSDSACPYAFEHAFGSLCLAQNYKIIALNQIDYKRQRKPSKKITKLKNLFTLGIIKNQSDANQPCQ
ncbi:MAG: rhamnan synthesis F family protein [Rickettsiales bacterium]|nr:rhamnan synthesis F family protein [Rickettsiales bacterium]